MFSEETQRQRIFLKDDIFANDLQTTTENGDVAAFLKNLLTKLGEIRSIFLSPINKRM